MHRKAFTLIELLVVIAILSILISIALNATSGARQRARDAQVKSDIQTFLKAWITHSSDQSTMQIAGVNDADPNSLILAARTATLVQATTNARATTVINSWESDGSLRSGFNRAGIYIASMLDSTTSNVNTTSTAIAVAVGKQLTTAASASISLNIYSDGTQGIDTYFNLPTIGNGLSWFVATQR